MSRRRSLTIALAVMLVVVACSPGSDSSADDPNAGPPVPDDQFTTFDGEQASLADFVGEPLVVNFWASWCPPCIAEMPEFEQVHRQRRDDVRFIGLNTQDEREQALHLIDVTGVTYDLGRDPDGTLFHAFEVIAMPSTYFVNSAGAIVHRHAGILSEAQLNDLINTHLAN